MRTIKIGISNIHVGGVHGLIFEDSEEYKRIMGRRKHLLTCAKNRRERKRKKRAKNYGN